MPPLSSIDVLSGKCTCLVRSTRHACVPSILKLFYVAWMSSFDLSDTLFNGVPTEHEPNNVLKLTVCIPSTTVSKSKPSQVYSLHAVTESPAECRLLKNCAPCTIQFGLRRRQLKFVTNLLIPISVSLDASKFVSTTVTGPTARSVVATTKTRNSRETPNN